MHNPVIIDNISIDDLRLLQEIDEACRKLHVPCPPRAFVDIKIGKEDDLITHYKSKSNSWVRNAHNFLCTNLLDIPLSYGGGYAAGKLGMKRTDGQVRSLSNSNGHIGPSYSDSGYTLYGGSPAFTGVSGDASSGIVVGTSNAAESLDQYILGAVIGNGTGAGQLSYNAHQAHVFAYDAQTRKHSSIISRKFNNNSSGTIVVAEIGVFAPCKISWVDGNSSMFMFIRDLVSPALDVPVGATLTVSYTLEYIMPA